MRASPGARTIRTTIGHARHDPCYPLLLVLVVLVVLAVLAVLLALVALLVTSGTASTRLAHSMFVKLSAMANSNHLHRVAQPNLAVNGGIQHPSCANMQMLCAQRTMSRSCYG